MTATQVFILMSCEVWYMNLDQDPFAMFVSLTEHNSIRAN